MKQRNGAQKGRKSHAFDGNLVVAASNFTDFPRFPNLETVPTKQGNNAVRSMGMRYRRRRTPRQTESNEECWRNGERNEHARGGWLTFKLRWKEWMRERETGVVSRAILFTPSGTNLICREKMAESNREKGQKRERQPLIDITVESPVFPPLGLAVFFFFAFRMAYSWRHS